MAKTQTADEKAAAKAAQQQEVPTVAPRQQEGAAGYQPMERLQQAHKTPPAVFAGVCAANSWRPGKCLTETEYLAAVKQFTNGTMDGRKHGPEKSEVKDSDA